LFLQAGNDEDPKSQHLRIRTLRRLMRAQRATIFGLALALVLIGDSWGQSQRPSPRARQQSGPPQAQAQSSQQPPADNRGTEAAPLVVRTIKSKEETAKDEQDRKDKAFNDYITIFLSAAVAIIGFLQFLTFVAMIRTSRRQLRAYVYVASAKVANAVEG